jgi:hypothetical protein
VTKNKVFSMKMHINDQSAVLNLHTDRNLHQVTKSMRLILKQLCEEVKMEFEINSFPHKRCFQYSNYEPKYFQKNVSRIFTDKKLNFFSIANLYHISMQEDHIIRCRSIMFIC